MTQKDVLHIINSEKWQNKRKEILEQSGYKCQNCNSKEHVEVFVDRVEALENPNNNDFNKISLCPNCFLYFYIKTLAHHSKSVEQLTDCICKYAEEDSKAILGSIPESYFD